MSWRCPLLPLRPSRLLAAALLMLLCGLSCSEDPTGSVVSLRSPATFLYAPNCVIDGSWHRFSDCPDPDRIVDQAFVTNEETASLSYVSIGTAGAKLSDTRLGVPGLTGVPIGERPRDAAATSDGAFVLTVNTLSSDISVVEVAKRREVLRVPTPEPPVKLTPVGDAFWLFYPSGLVEIRALAFDCGAGSNQYDENLCALDETQIAFEVSASFLVEGQPKAALSLPTNERVFVSYTDKLYLSVLVPESSQETCLQSGEMPPCEVERLPGGYGCSDGLDNDGDGFIDGEDPQCYLRGGAESVDGVGVLTRGACNDGIDNDGDGFADAFDPGCTSTNDGGEEDGQQELQLPQCVDGIDNDGDGLVDNRDADCLDSSDGSEDGSSLLPACDDGVDNDQDGAIDFPEDSGCDSFSDDTEGATNSCGDGLDNDGDGLVDLEDSGCSDLSDDSEGAARGFCNDGVDNDGDGAIDLADDGCYGASGMTEKNVERSGLGPMAVDPGGSLYVVDSTEWQVIVIDLATSQVVDAGARNPFSTGPGIRVNAMPKAVAADIRSSTIVDAGGGVTIKRDEAVFYAATTAGTLDVGSVSQTFQRFENQTVTDTVELPTLKVGDNRDSVASVVSRRCLNIFCDESSLPTIELRARPSVFVTDAGALLTTGDDGKPTSVPVDELYVPETWQLIYEGILPNAERSDGLFDAAGGELRFGGNFCSLGVVAGDHVIVEDSPSSQKGLDCGELRDKTREFEVAQVRADALYLQPLDDPTTSSQLPNRSCYPWGTRFTVRASKQFVASGTETGSLLGRSSRGGVCSDAAGPLGGGRFAFDEKFENALFKTTIPTGSLPAERGVGIEFSVTSGYVGLRLQTGPLPGDVVVVPTLSRKYVFVPDGGSNQVFIFDAANFSSFESL